MTRLQILDFKRVAVKHGPDYLYTEYVIRVRGLFNPAVNPYLLLPLPTAFEPAPNLAGLTVVTAGTASPDLGLVPIFNAAGVGLNVLGGITTATVPGSAVGVIAPVTDISLRHFLMQPRRQLVYAVGPTPLVVSPGINSDGSASTTDADNGPEPLACDVVQVSGTKTFVVDFTIRTCVNEAQLFVATPSALLAHRYSITEEIDQDYYATRTIRGMAKFRSDRLIFIGGLPDDFRQSLFHPLPGLRWKRNLANVEASEDGTTLAYTLVDRETAFGIVPEHVTRIEAWEECGSNLPFNAQGVGKAVGKLIEKLVDAAGGDSFGMKAARGGFGLVGSLIPLLETTIVVRVWGDSRARRKDLESVAIQIILARISLMRQDNKGRAAATEFQILHDLFGTYVEARCEKVTSLSDAAFSGPGAGGGKLPILPDVAQYFPDSDDTPGYIEYANASNLMQRGLPARPNAAGTGTRSNRIVQLATAALLAPNATPANPPPAPLVGRAVTDRAPP